MRSHIAAANRYAQRYADGKRRHQEFAVGDHVLLSTQNLPLPASASRKLAPRWLGPLPVVERIGAVAYRLQLPSSLHRLHDVFHVGLLKPFQGQPPPVQEPIFTTEGTGDHFEVERITAHRVTRNRRQFLVQWRGYPVWEATWEPEQNLDGAEELLSTYKAANALD